jgi:uncharacterized membrane protein
MTKFMAAIFENREKAERAGHAIRDLEREGSLLVHGLAVVERDAAGQLEIVEKPSGLSGQAVSVILSELSSAVSKLPTPGLGLLEDLGSWKDLVDFGVTPDFIQKLASGLVPGKATVIAEIEEDWITPLDSCIEEMGGFIMRTWRADFEAEQLAKEGRPRSDRPAKAQYS